VLGWTSFTGAQVLIYPENAVYFSPLPIGSTSPPQYIKIINTDYSKTLSFSSITLSGSDFEFANKCGKTLGPRASCKVTVYFRPKATGDRSGYVAFSENESGSPQSRNLIGEGTPAHGSVTVQVNPVSPCALPSHSQQFSARVSNTTNTGVSWYVDNILNGNSTHGTITSGGLYTSPVSAGSHVIKAVSKANTSAYGSSSIAVTSKPNFTVNPAKASVPVLGEQSFEARICSQPDAHATYSVDNIAGGNSVVGTIRNDGLYTAPKVSGQHTIRATNSSINKTSAAVATVYSNVVVDFGSRTNAAFPIAANLFGVNHADNLRTVADMKLVSKAVTNSRTYALIPQTFATRTPNWTKIDQQIANLQTAGLQHPIIEMAYTPTWLQPKNNKCGAGNPQVMPASVSEWASIAKAYVAHFDAKFPGFVQDYEIWNEPDGGGLCERKVNDYLKIYAAAAPVMKEQAAADGAHIRIGGPAAASVDSPFIPKLLSDHKTAPYVDFVSYHQYLYGPSERSAKWDAVNNGIKSLYQKMQEAGDGAAAAYSKADALVKAGKQPLGARTPIYIDEYNTNWGFVDDCCRNHPTFSPLFNALYVTDVLNTVYSGTQAVPGKLDYYAATAAPFCLVGTRDSTMSCHYAAGVTPVPYAQYYLYELLSSPSYLGLATGGHLAPSVTPRTSGSGIAVLGFYTAARDAILITNPTYKNLSEITVEAKHIGYANPRAVLYEIVNGKTISRSSLPLSRSADGTTYTATFPLAAFRVVAISITGS
jgi:hypothetical protein